MHGAAEKEMGAWREQGQCNTQGGEFPHSKQKPLGM